jgi:hypothetical protein
MAGMVPVAVAVLVVAFAFACALPMALVLVLVLTLQVVADQALDLDLAVVDGAALLVPHHVVVLVESSTSVESLRKEWTEA